MEDRSSRRMRTLVTLMAHGGLSGNETVCTLISMVARGTKRSNRRPDTLMQDRQPLNRRNFLRHTAGPYMRVISPVWPSAEYVRLSSIASVPRCPHCFRFTANFGNANLAGVALDVTIRVSLMR